MKKVLFLAIIAFVFIGFSCNKQESMQEKIRKEKRATEAFIDRQNFKVLKDYPKDGVFAENEYFRTPDGLYIHVVDSGNGRRAVPILDEVLVRFDYFLDIIAYVKDESTGKYLAESVELPKEFIFGNTNSYSKDRDRLVCNGWAFPLNYVGEGAIVNLIVPSSMAGSDFSNSFTPTFFKNLRYTTFY
jgi:hypothetical protein